MSLPRKLEEIYQAAYLASGWVNVVADNIVAVAREFHYRVEEVLDMPLPRFKALLVFLEKENDKQKLELDKAKSKGKRKR